MKKIKTQLKVLVVSLIVLLAVVAGGMFYLNDYYIADETACRVLEDSQMGVTVSGEEGEPLVFTPRYSNKIDKALIFYPGARVDYSAYAPLMEKLAKKGILCILVKMPFNMAIFDVNAAERIRQQYPSIKEWYIVGHSLGGVAAAMNMEKYSGNYKGIVILGGYSSVNLADKELSALCIYGDQDQITNRAEIENCRQNLPAGYREAVIQGGNHCGFGNYGFQRGDGIATISSEEQQTKTAEIIAEWMGK